jgi:prolyl 4-hydroxylase
MARPSEEAFYASVRYKCSPSLPGSDQALLTRIGESVASCLQTSPAVQPVPAVNMDMFMMRDFMSDAECAAMMDLIDEGAEPSTIYTKGSNDGHRTSQTCRLSNANELVASVEKRMADLLGLPLSHSETLQGQKYQVGQQFKIHTDYIAGGQPHSQSFADEGGQRTWTVMVYLNRVGGGGCTNFPRALVSVAPVAGALLTWNNNDRFGRPNPFARHEGEPVEAGTKYILTKWFREREWTPNKAVRAYWA